MMWLITNPLYFCVEATASEAQQIQKIGKRIPRTRGWRKRAEAMMRGAAVCVTLLGEQDLHAADDALREVNAARAARGLRPFIRDQGLTDAAGQCADLRAKWLCAGHTRNDFAALGRGVRASASGCAAWEPSWGWGACCTYESWTYAGAAVTTGRDGRRYMHLFVR